jgi:hypothetical protein
MSLRPHRPVAPIDMGIPTTSFVALRDPARAPPSVRKTAYRRDQHHELAG